MPLRFALHLAIGALLAGCAGGGSLIPPQALPARIYSPVEKLQPGPWNNIAMDGEVRYCTSLDVINGTAKGEEIRKSALANIGKVCGGKDEYGIVHESRSDAQYLAMGGLVTSTCPVATGRALHFKCNRPVASTATTKTPGQ
jgi:hypothetical protein